MTQGAAREYRILMRRKPELEQDGPALPQFTLVVEAASPESAVAEAEKLSVMFQGKFSVGDIQPNQARESFSRAERVSTPRETDGEAAGR